MIFKRSEVVCQCARYVKKRINPARMFLFRIKKQKENLNPISLKKLLSFQVNQQKFRFVLNATKKIDINFCFLIFQNNLGNKPGHYF